MTKVEIEIKAEQGSEGESTCRIVLKLRTFAEIVENATTETKLLKEEAAMAIIIEQCLKTEMQRLKTEIPRIVAKNNRDSQKNAGGGAK